MINTVNTKKEQLEKGFFSVGTGERQVLIMGSCRAVPYVSYFDEYNKVTGNQFTINFTDPFNFNWDENDARVDYEDALLKAEKNENILSLLKRVEIFIHEYYSHAGMFNCNPGPDKNIYQFGLSPGLDICIPNFNDCFILAADIVAFDLEIRKKAIQDYNVLGRLSDETVFSIYEISRQNLSKFLSICMKSDVTAMKYYFELNFVQERFFYTSNHVSKKFTMAILDFMNQKYLGWDFSKVDLESIPDLYADHYTKLTDVDLKLYDYKWKEKIIPLSEKLF